MDIDEQCGISAIFAILLISSVWSINGQCIGFVLLTKYLVLSYISGYSGTSAITAIDGYSGSHDTLLELYLRFLKY